MFGHCLSDISKMLALFAILAVSLVSAGPVTKSKLPKLVGMPLDFSNDLGTSPEQRFPPVPKNGTMDRDFDLILTDEQVEMMFEEDSNGRVRRKATSNEKFRWTDNTMPYEFNGDEYTDKEKREIREAMDEYEKMTCLKFRPANSRDVNKVLFKQGQGCNSQLGMVGGTQALNLDKAGCRWKGLYWHEIGHAIGLHHEHQMPDRDRYIKVKWNNVNPAFYTAFSKEKPSDVVETPYDLTSVMHYEIKAFSQSGGQTIVPRDKYMEPYIGNVWISQMSWTDVMIVNKMYKCADRCGRVNCPDGFVNKECKCVTPKSYFDSHCINEHDEEECYERAHKGDCDVDYGFMNFKCRKACNRCAMYGMDNLIKGKQGGCFNLYHDERRCAQWAKAGDCDKYPSFMKRMCKKSCKTCNSDWGNCANMNFDKACDDWATRGECESNSEWMKNRCADSCKTCGYITPGKCKNDHPNESECTKWSRAGQCYDDDLKRAFWMKKNCAGTCNSCGFGKGNCANELSDFDCDKMAHMGQCITDPRNAQKKCKKSCNSCSYGVRGNCKNLYETMYGDAGTCNGYADQGNCDFNKGYLLIFCASACNRCQESKQLIANCKDLQPEEKCKKWRQSGECDGNGGFMRFNCAKTCKTCHMLTNEKICADTAGAATCKFWKEEKDMCTKDVRYMKMQCRLTCGLCEAGEKRVPDPAPPKCKNIGTDERCDRWARGQSCSSNKEWMERMCHRSCNNVACGGKVDLTDPCADTHENCAQWAKQKQCELNPGFMHKSCYKSCFPEKCGGTKRPGSTSTSTSSTTNGGGRTAGCADMKSTAQCVEWKSWGHCEISQSVSQGCAKTCGFC